MFHLPFNASKIKGFSFKSGGCIVWNENGDMYRQLQPNKTKVKLYQPLI